MNSLVSHAEGGRLLRLCPPLVRRSNKHCRCITTDIPPRRPDLAIYSQPERLQQGMTASWESPDVLTNWWDPWRLMDAIDVKVRNLSPEASAVNTVIQVEWAPFGIGTPKQSLGAQVANFAAPDERNFQFPINDLVRAQGPNVSITINIPHPHDKNPGNNLGFQAIHGVRTSQVGRTPSFTFPVVNDSPLARQITLTVQPNDIAASVTPASRLFAPHEQIMATLNAHIPASIAPAPGEDFVLKQATVVAYGPAGQLLGGVTFLVRVDV